MLISRAMRTYREAAYHARNQESQDELSQHQPYSRYFHESSHTVAMIRHSIEVVRSAVEHLNPGQTPVVTVDQPLFALAKEIQWTWPDRYGEESLVIMFGGLHIEMAALKTVW